MKYTLTALLLLGSLSLSACGCGDSGPTLPPPPVTPSASAAVFSLATEFPPCPIPPPTPPEAMKIDVFFLLDDSTSMVFGELGLIPRDTNDDRKRSEAAQAIFADIRAQLMADLDAAKTAGRVPADAEFDLAFGVGRFEDYSGFQTITPDPATGDFVPGTIDEAARPFLLNMPLLREAHPLFDSLFPDALAREALGDGSPASDQLAVITRDPQSAVEALFQIATGAGFDGDGNESTLDSGPPCSDTAQAIVSPTPAPPGPSGDVPAVEYILQSELDPDGQPVFDVVAPGATEPADTCIASGNLGGAGWRPDAARFVILASDIATVAPFRDSEGNPSDPLGFVTSTDGAPDAPRDSRNVNPLAFANKMGRYPRDVIVDGTPTRLPIAPPNAAGVQQMVDALNALDIEVFSIGSPAAVGADSKPNNNLDNPPFPIPEPSDINAIPSPDEPAITPYTYMSAVSLLTIPLVDDETTPGNPTYPAVYNLGTVAYRVPLDADPADIPDDVDPTPGVVTIRDHVREDLVERIAIWVNGGYLQASPGGTGDRPPLPTLFLDFTLELTDEASLPGFPFMQDPDVGTTFTTTVQVPVYWADETAPAPVQVPLAPLVSPFVYTALDANAVPVTDMLPYDLTITFNDIGNLTEENATQAQYLRSKIPSEEEPIASAGGALEMTAHAGERGGESPPPRGVVFSSHEGWCITLDDASWGFDFGEETQGSCSPSPLQPPAPIASE